MDERAVLPPAASVTELESVRSVAPDQSVLDICKLAYPPLFRGPRYLAVIRAFCDESYDGQSRIYTIAGFLGRDKQWNDLTRRWRNRCLRDKVQCYHAADCVGRYGEFAQLSQEQVVDLHADLIDEIVRSRLVGFATSLVPEDYRRVSTSSEKARRVLGSSPYFLSMQTFLVNVCGEIRDSRPNYRVAFVFDQHEDSVDGRSSYTMKSNRRIPTSLLAWGLCFTPTRNSSCHCRLPTN